MKKFLSILLAMFVGMSVVGCGSTECAISALGDEICVFDSDLETRVYRNGKLDDYFGGPAILTCKYFTVGKASRKTEHYRNGKRHSVCGPAITDFNGYGEWWVEGVRYSEKEFNEMFKGLCEPGNGESSRTYYGPPGPLNLDGPPPELILGH